MNHRIHLAVKTESFNKPLSGEVEVGEIYVGEKESNKHIGKNLIKVVEASGNSSNGLNAEERQNC